MSKSGDILRIGSANLLNVQDILPRGHVIHGYSSADNTRIIAIQESRRYSDQVPLLGFGEDGTAERALGRALVTYALRETEGLEHMTQQQYPESTVGQIPKGACSSRFDNIVWIGNFWLYQNGDEFIAGSTWGGREVRPLEVAATSALGAITALAEIYDFGNDISHRLPVIAIE